MRVRSRDDVAIRTVDAAMDRDGGCIHRSGTVMHVSFFVDTDQVVRVNRRKVLCVRIDPETVVELRITNRDMTGDTFREAKPGEDAESRREFQLAMLTLRRNVVEHSRNRQL